MGKISPGVEGALLNTGQSLVGTGMGLLLEGHNDRRQLKQQGKLLNQQYNIDTRMAEANYDRQLQMWKDTGYGAQMEQIAAAGLNPAMLYKSGGDGGMTVGNQGGAVGGAKAPVGGMEVMNMMMARAQMGLIQAQTEKTKAEAQNVPLEGKNIEANTALTNIQTKLKEGTYDWDKEAAYEAMVQLGQQNRILSSQADVAEGTQNTQIEQQKQTLLETGAKIALLQTQKEVSDAEINNIASQIATRIKQLEYEGDRVAIQKQLAEWETSWGKQVAGLLGNIIQIIPGMRNKKK